MGGDDGLSGEQSAPQRAVDMMEMYGTERLCVNAAADWGERSAADASDVGRRGEAGLGWKEQLRVFYNNLASFSGSRRGFG